MRTVTTATVLSQAVAVLSGTAQLDKGNSIELLGRHPDGRVVPVYLTHAFVATDTNDTKIADREFHDGWTADGKKHDLCGTCVFEDILDSEGGRSDATLNDCRAIASSLGGQAGWFNVTGGGYGLGSSYGTLARSGGCTFGVYREDNRDDSFGVGDSDVVDILTWAADHYGKDGKLHVVGEGPCGPVWFGFEIYGDEKGVAPPE